MAWEATWILTFRTSQCSDMSHRPKLKRDSFYEAVNITCFTETDSGNGIFNTGKCCAVTPLMKTVPAEEIPGGS